MIYPLSLGLHSQTDIVAAINDLHARLTTIELKEIPVSTKNNMAQAPVERPVRFDPIISKWESNRRFADWCGPGAVVSVPADELYHILDRIREVAREVEIAKAERNKAHVDAHRKAMEMVRQAEEGRQYWMHAALGRETGGDDRDSELLRLTTRLHEVESNPQVSGPPSGGSTAPTCSTARGIPE